MILVIQFTLDNLKLFILIMNFSTLTVSARLVPILNLADMPGGSLCGKPISFLIALMNRDVASTIRSVENCCKLCISSSTSLKFKQMHKNEED